VRIETETITPKRAQEWLDRSHGLPQRSVSTKRVEKLSHAILGGQWQLTHQPIALDAEGRVLDGQHRLNAIVEAGLVDPEVSVDALIAWEADPATFGVIDTGAVRTTGDTLRIAGYTDANHVAATVRCLMTYRAIAGTTEAFERRSRLFTTVDVMDYLDEPDRSDRVRTSLLLAHRISASIGRFGTRSALATTIAIAAEDAAARRSALGSDGAYEFFERLSDGAMLASTSPILALRRWMMRDTGFARLSGNLRRWTTIAVTIKAMNDYALGRERHLVAFKTGIEIMPRLVTPEEAEAVRVQHENGTEIVEAMDEAGIPRREVGEA
jgi:hypothetical protein